MHFAGYTQRHINTMIIIHFNIELTKIAQVGMCNSLASRRSGDRSPTYSDFFFPFLIILHASSNMFYKILQNSSFFLL